MTCLFSFLNFFSQWLPRRLSYRLALFPLFLLSGCSWLGKAPPPPLPGKRISVENHDAHVKVDPSVAQRSLSLAPLKANSDWPQYGENASHNSGGILIHTPFKAQWSQSIGSGSSTQNRLLSLPIVANDKIFTLDASFLVTCFDLKTGERLWEESVTSETRRALGLGGGLAYSQGHVIITTSVGEVISLNEQTGAMEWRVSLNYPQRSAPTIVNNKIYVLSLQNTLTALDVSTGDKLWSHSGSSEVIGILGGAPAAATESIVIVPYSSGEVFALSAENGSVLWSDSLALPIFGQGIDALSHIRSAPVIENDSVYVMSHSGPLVSFNLFTGHRNWEQSIGGINSLVVSGECLFVLSGSGDLLCLEKSTGRIKWVCPLGTPPLSDTESSKKNDSEKSDTPSSSDQAKKFSGLWGGPLLTSAGLLITTDDGHLMRIDPLTGAHIDTLSTGDPVFLSPIAAQKNLITLSDTGYLTLWGGDEAIPS